MTSDLAWLPDKKFYEYAYHKFFSENPINYESWKPWDEWTYPARDILRFSHIIQKQLQYITNKKVLDVACHLGYISLFCLHNGCSFVTGTNVREKELAIGREIIDIAGYKNYRLIFSDLNNLDEFSKLCSEHETVIFSGIIYHIQNHYEILKKVYESSARTMIIEGLQPSNFVDNLPVIYWKKENTLESTNAFDANKKSCFIGIPTQEWVINAAIDIGWNIVYNETIEYLKPDNIPVNRYIITINKDS